MWHWQAPVAALVAAAVFAQPTPAQQAGMMEAVRQMLQQAHVPKQDMPSKIISVEPLGGERYKVHMQMVQGEGWFELKWTGTRWEASGLNR
ncbi:MAG TPA: hypothetical protein VD969_23100 [Symbiobacteriaceae bacterium]|nr:hypothetical protein [Symbiobacteriaceae bacterium]